MGVCKSVNNMCIGEADTLYIDNIIEFDDEAIKISKETNKNIR